MVISDFDFAQVLTNCLRLQKTQSLSNWRTGANGNPKLTNPPLFVQHHI